MSAFTELAIFCGDHPEIRAHKRIGELLQATAAELAQLKFDKDELTKSILALRGEMVLIKGMWKETIDKNAQLRTENEEAKKLLDELERAECNYRADHDVRGDGSLETGRAWDHMRHCGERASTFLKAHPERK